MCCEMQKTIEVVYEKGVFKPSEPVELKEGERRIVEIKELPEKLFGSRRMHQRHCLFGSRFILKVASLYCRYGEEKRGRHLVNWRATLKPS